MVGVRIVYSRGGCEEPELRDLFQSLFQSLGRREERVLPCSLGLHRSPRPSNAQVRLQGRTA